MNLSETLPLGPRRTAVEKAEREVLVAEEVFNLAIDNRDWLLASQLLAELRQKRAEVDRLLTVWILDLPGAEEWRDAT